MNKASGGQASVPMNLFATWEIDKSSTNCIPRICTMTICKLIVPHELDKDLQSVFIAVKMQGYKRVFRSNEISMSSNGLVDTKLELTFSLQYPHFVKRDENRLHIMLQRKKRYKNRAMLGYKTLAVGKVDMAQIIQCPIPVPNESTLDLFTTGKDQKYVLAAHIVISGMNSLPIDAEMESDRTGKHGGADRSTDVGNSSEDDEESYSSEQDMDYVDEEPANENRKHRRKVRMSSSSRQQNFIKTKVSALLRKFKQVDDEEPDMEQDRDSPPAVPVDYDFLYDELEEFNLSDSCPELDDNISIVSTPKPTLRPFFDRISHSSSQTEISSLREQLDAVGRDAKVSDFSHLGDGDMASGTCPMQKESDLHDSEDPDDQATMASVDLSEPMHKDKLTRLKQTTTQATSAPSSPELHSAKPHESAAKRSARSASFRDHSNAERCKEINPTVQDEPTLCDSFRFLDSDDGLPESLCLVDGNDKFCRHIACVMKAPALGLPAPIVTHSLQDIQAVFASLLSKLQKYLNSNSQSPSPIKVALIGADRFLSNVLQQFVECLSARSPDWQTFLTFFIVPFGSPKLARYISSVDSRYGTLFGEISWKKDIEKLAELSPSQLSSLEPNESVLTVASKLKEYISEASHVMSLTIAEAMLTFRQMSGDEDCSQKFLPFISDVKVGESEQVGPLEADKEDASLIANNSNSYVVSPITTCASTQTMQSSSLPMSVLQTSTTAATQNGSSGVNQSADIKLGLQVDYWKERDASKYTLKTNIKSFRVNCLPPVGEQLLSPGLALDVVTKGKKNIMRLPGKKGKERDSDSKFQAVGNINRLICASKHQHSLLQVKIDGVEWRCIKFFQLSSHWSSHIKVFPIAVFVPT